MRQEKANNLYKEGMALFRSKKFANAENAFKKAIKLNPKHADAYNDLGNLYQEWGRFKEAHNAYRKALKLVPKHPMLMNNLGSILLLQGDYGGAIHWLKESVKKAPDNAATFTNLGNSFRGLGDNARALRSFRRAVELDDKQAIYFCNLGRALLEDAALDEAVDCYQRALEINPNDSRAHLGLGRVWSAMGEFDKAVASCERAIEIDPGNAKCYNGLAGVFEEHGDTEDAIANARKAISIDPGNVFAYQTLAWNTRYREYDPEMEAMESLYSKKGLEDSKKSHLAFGLGKAYENIADYDKSIDFVLNATRLRRGMYDYSIADAESQFEAIKQFFSPQFFSEFADSGADDKTPVFIIGMPRSGTSLVEQILASHPEVYGAGEMPDLEKVYHSIHGPDGDLQNHKFPQGLSKLDAAGFSKLGEMYVERMRRYAPDAKYITDKLPHNFLRVGLIRAILPGACVVNCTRDPMDNCFSIFKTDFRKGHRYSYDMTELGRYYRLYQDLMDHWRETLPGFVYDQGYEALVSEPRAQIERLLEHCGLPWDDACLDFHKTHRRVATASSAQVKRPIYKDSVNLWSRYEKQLEPLAQALQA